jgi:methylmalonyl-CoA epimerase
LNESDRFEVAIFEIGESTIELLAPTSPDSIIGRFIAKRGPGIHHIALRVRDTDAALNHCEAAGIQLLDSTSRRGTDGTKIGFLGPKSTMGTLIELVEVADRE